MKSTEPRPRGLSAAADRASAGNTRAAATSPAQPNPYALARGEGQVLHSFRARVVVKAAADQTGRTFNLFEVTCPPGYATSLDIHYAEDVAVYVLEGTLTLYWGSQKKTGSAGCYFYQPRGIPHGFRVAGNAPARILYLTLPAGLDGLIRENDQRAAGPEFMAAAARHKIEVLGPLPE